MIPLIAALPVLFRNLTEGRENKFPETLIFLAGKIKRSSWGGFSVPDADLFTTACGISAKTDVNNHSLSAYVHNVSKA